MLINRIFPIEVVIENVDEVINCKSGEVVLINTMNKMYVITTRDLY